jgi:hypothetical protein
VLGSPRRLRAPGRLSGRLERLATALAPVPAPADDRILVPVHHELPDDWLEGPPRDHRGRTRPHGADGSHAELDARARETRARERAAQQFSQPPPAASGGDMPPLPPRRAKPRRRALRWRG